MKLPTDSKLNLNLNLIKTYGLPSDSDSSLDSQNLNSPISPTQSWPEPSPQPSQQLIITLIGARALTPPQDSLEPTLRPYAVLQFDHTESITNEASSSNSKPAPTRWRALKPHYRSNPINSNSSSFTPNHHTPSRVCHLTQTNPSELEHPIWNHVAIFDIFKPRSSLFISIYHHHYRTSDPDLPAQEKTEKFLGGTVVDLRALMKSKSIDNIHQTQLINPPTSAAKTRLLLDDSIDLWDESGQTTTGSIVLKIEIKAINHHDPHLDWKDPKPPFVHNTSPIKKTKISMDDFEIIKLIGEGSYGQVYRIRKKDTKRLYAMKTLEKSKILISKEGRATRSSSETIDNGHHKIKLERVLTERKILEKTRGCEFLVGLKFSFQTNDNLNLVMDLKSGGELMSYMQRFGGRFQESWVIFYTAEILSGLKFLHSMNIAYRDLKPENCLLDATGHVALCDFGLSKLDMKPDAITNTFCGTTEYIAPEVLLEKGYTRVVDFWSLGVLIFEMSVGWTPFFSENRAARYSLILESDITTKFPKRGISDVTKNIILRLLERDPSLRLGSTGIQEIETHEFFVKLDWKALVRRRLTPPFKPRVESDTSLSYSSDPIYSYGGRRSNSATIDRLTNRAVIDSTTTNRGGGRSKNTQASGLISSAYVYSQQHSRRSSVENRASSAVVHHSNSSGSHDGPNLNHRHESHSHTLFTTGLDTDLITNRGHDHFRDFTFSRDTD